MRVGKNSLQGYRNPKFGHLNLRKLKAKKLLINTSIFMIYKRHPLK